MITKFLNCIFICITCLTSSQAIFAQTLHTLHDKENKKIGTVRTINHDGLIYGSLQDISSAIAVNTFFNKKRGKVVMYLADDREIKVTANNPFIVIGTNPGSIEDDKIFQMPLATRWINKDIYVPLDLFLKMIEFDQQPAYSQHEVVQTPLGKRPVNIKSIAIENKSNGTLIRIKTTEKFEAISKRESPGWVYIDIYGGKLDSISIVRDTRLAGMIKHVLPMQFPEIAILGFELKQKIESPEIYQDQKTLDLILTLRNSLPKQTKPAMATDVKKSLDEDKEKWRINTIILDAGHGGRDPGSIGPSGKREKDVALDVVKRLGSILEKKTNMRIIYTRKKDIFIPLHQRTKIANKENGKLFISIHCNANNDKRASGFETYILRPGKTKAAIDVAERENSVVSYEEDGYKYEDLTEENFILATMAQSAFVKESENFAALIQQELDHKIDTKNRGVKQAGFYVLIGASMPNVLIELGFITNAYEEKQFKQKKYRQRLAGAIYEGIIKFKQRYESGFF